MRLYALRSKFAPARRKGALRNAATVWRSMMFSDMNRENLNFADERVWILYWQLARPRNDIHSDNVVF